MIITSWENSEKLARKLTKQLRATYSQLTISSFPDGDIYLKYNCDLKDQILILVHSFQPNSDQSLFDVVFAAETAKDLGAKKVILVAPYLAYMRQDKRFNPGEAISSRIMAKLLNNSIDELITIDPHLHRYKSLKEIFSIKTKTLTADQLIADYLQKRLKNVVIIGPDGESYQWAETIAKQIGVEATVLIKTRLSSRNIKSKIIHPIPIKGRNVVIIDDIISTGHTIAEAAKKAKSLGAKSVTALGVHGIFAENAIPKMKKAGVDKIITTNCIEHSTNGIDISSLILKELKTKR
ncbi:MAG TPA: ribose-phosphate diphosphokinase [Bacteroidia bacterium]|nr:ribose-phosphate diphosphokinase [Bacteroidia bacterium]